MLNYLFITMEPGSSPGPNIYYRTKITPTSTPRWAFYHYIHTIYRRAGALTPPCIRLYLVYINSAIRSSSNPFA